MENQLLYNNSNINNIQQKSVNYIKKNNNNHNNLHYNVSYNKGLESEINDYLMYMESKIIWKNAYNKENINNGIKIKPINTLTSYNNLIRPNIRFISNNEIVYLSGSNLVKHNIESNEMILYPIINNSVIKSIFVTSNIKNQSLVILGQSNKYNYNLLKNSTIGSNKINRNEEVYPSIEIIYTDKSLEKSNILFKMDNNIYSNTIVSEAIILQDSDIAVISLKSINLKFNNKSTTNCQVPKKTINTNNNENKKTNLLTSNSKLLVRKGENLPLDASNNNLKDSNLIISPIVLVLIEYTSRQLLQYIPINTYNLEKFICLNYHQFILYGKSKIEFWSYMSSNRKIKKTKDIYENKSNIITSIAIIKTGGLVISLNNFKLNLYNSSFDFVYELDLSYKLQPNTNSFNSIINNLKAVLKNLIIIDNIIICFVQESKDVLIFQIKFETCLNQVNNNNNIHNKNSNKALRNSKLLESFDSSKKPIKINLVAKVASETNFNSKTDVIANKNNTYMLYCSGESNINSILHYSIKKFDYKKSLVDSNPCKINYYLYKFNKSKINNLRIREEYTFSSNQMFDGKKRKYKSIDFINNKKYKNELKLKYDLINIKETQSLINKHSYKDKDKHNTESNLNIYNNNTINIISTRKKLNLKNNHENISFESDKAISIDYSKNSKNYSPNYKISSPIIGHKTARSVVVNIDKANYKEKNFNLKYDDENSLEHEILDNSKNTSSKEILDNSNSHLEVASNYTEFNTNTKIFDFKKEILHGSNTGSKVKLMSISLNPKIIIIVFENKIKHIYKQKDETNTVSYLNTNNKYSISCNNNFYYNNKNHQYNHNYSTFKNNLSKITNNQTSINLKKDLINNINNNCIRFELSIETKLESDPLYLSLSPYGNMYIISFQEYTYIYSILNKDIKDIVKINSFCKAVSFSKTGKYIAFSRSQFINSNYSISVLNCISFEIEYIIYNLSHYAIKIEFLYKDSILSACLEDNNIFAWIIEDNREIYQNNEFKDKENSRNKVIKDPYLYMRNLEVSEKIIDYQYDIVLDMLVIIIDDLRLKVYKGTNIDKFYEFYIPQKYSCSVIIKEVDLILFGTENGCIHCYLWPFAKFSDYNTIPTPYYIENQIHLQKVVNISISSDLKNIISSSLDGSIIISSIETFIDGEKMNFSYNENIESKDIIKIMKSSDKIQQLKKSYSVSNVNSSNYNTYKNNLIYFDENNILFRKEFINYSQYTSITDVIYNDKKGKITNNKNEILSKNNGYSTELDRREQFKNEEINNTRINLNKEVEEHRLKVKELEEKKEDLTKNIKTTKENQANIYKKVIEDMRSKYKLEKETLYEKTKELGTLFNEVSNSFKEQENKVINDQETTNKHIENILYKMLDFLKNKEEQIIMFIDKKLCSYKSKLNDLENEYETKLRDIESKSKKEIEAYEETIENHKNYAKAIAKKVKDFEEKIKELRKNKEELDNNNIELQENLAANTVRLKNMSMLLNENERTISSQEKTVKLKREINARLEKLRYVLEYQITNLIKEKTPIEEQIKSFEELYNDFNKRFNQLYSEQLNIKDCINENDNLIKNFKSKLFQKKLKLYKLKNLYNSISLEIGFIFINNNMPSKEEILEQLEIIYEKYLNNMDEECSYLNKDNSNEAKIQNKIIDKEIKKQKNKVLADLMNKRKEINEVKKEKVALMLSIQKENTLFIEQCTSIRLNLNEILKNINDIEKKFIELTNTYAYLNKEDASKNIKDNLKVAKKTIQLADTGSKNHKKSDVSNINIISDKQRYEEYLNNININSNQIYEDLNEILKGNNNDLNNNNLRNNSLLAKFENNINKEFVKTNQIENIEKKIKDMIANKSQSKSNLIYSNISNKNIKDSNINVKNNFNLLLDKYSNDSINKLSNKDRSKLR